MKIHQKGFTLVELLASTAMCSVLAGLALPIVQQSREDARLIECANKIATIAAGSAMYEDANGKMPPVSTATGPNAFFESDPHQHTGAIAYILPFVGEEALFSWLPAIATQPGLDLDNFEFDGSFTLFLIAPNMLSAVNHKPELLICPSDAAYNDVQVGKLYFSVGRGDPNGQVFTSLFNVNSTAFGRTSYLPSIGGFFNDAELTERAIDIAYLDAAGPMRNRLESIAVSELGDGSSNTILWGESLGSIDPNDAPEFRDGANMSLFEMGIVTGHRWQAFAQTIMFGSAESSIQFLIGSMHPDGCNVAMADGSIRFIDRRTGRGVMAALGCGNDGWITPRR